MSEKEFESPVVGKGWVNCLLMLFTVTCILKSCTYLKKKYKIEDDSIIEELTERLIEKELGLSAYSIDFTPNGPVPPENPE